MCDQGYNLTFHSKGCEISKVCLGISSMTKGDIVGNIVVIDVKDRGDYICPR
jgi:hypothetical protein